MVLTGTKNGGTISVNSNSGSVVQEPELQTTYINPTPSAGYFSDETSYVDGVSIAEPVTINQWNNDLSFNYVENGTSTNVSLTLDSKDYGFANLETALQEKIDAALGNGKLKVTVGSTGVRIETANVGSKYYLENSFSGDFYDKVLCSTKERTVTDNPEISNGTAPNDIAYTIGRKDVRNVPVEIKSGVNDTLSLDFKYGNNTTEFEITLDAGTYKGDALKDMIQEKLDAAMVAKGFEPGTIEVGIGGITTGVTGSNDANALNFRLSKSV